MDNEDAEKGTQNGARPSEAGRNWLGWLFSVGGWLVCAGMCLETTILLEAWPAGYDALFPAILLIIFCNVFVFLFIAARWGSRLKTLAAAVVRVCAGEGLFLAGIYALGRYFF